LRWKTTNIASDRNLAILNRNPLIIQSFDRERDEGDYFCIVYNKNITNNAQYRLTSNNETSNYSMNLELESENFKLKIEKLPLKNNEKTKIKVICNLSN
jgi:hypothetical protein